MEIYFIWVNKIHKEFSAVSFGGNYYNTSEGFYISMIYALKSIINTYLEDNSLITEDFL